MRRRVQTITVDPLIKYLAERYEHVKCHQILLSKLRSSDTYCNRRHLSCAGRNETANISFEVKKFFTDLGQYFSSKTYAMHLREFVQSNFEEKHA